MANTHRHTVSQEEILAESKLIEAAKRDRSRFEVLYNTYYERIFRFAYQRVDEKEVAFDITQQVFMKAMVNLSNYEFRGLPFSAWLYRIAQNELNQLFRKNSAHRSVNIDETDLRSLVDEMQTDSLEEYSQKLPDVISELDEEDLQLVEMRFFEKRAFKEIADILEITENNAKVKLYRILDKMKEQLLKGEPNR
jgi:RNA polymerase sigma-70 factor, ECF subfamily